MAVRSIASLSLSFGLVAIPVKLYSATESAAAIRFKLMASNGARVRQQYVTTPAPQESAPAMDDSRNRAAAAPVHAAPVHAAPVEAARKFGSPSKVLDFQPRRAPSAPPQDEHEAPHEPEGLHEPDAPLESVIERSAMMKGYEYEKGRYVLFTPEELKALEAASRQTIDIVSFIPENEVDPIFYDKAYLLAPDKRGSKPYSLLLRAMRDTGRCALAKWAFRSKEYVAQIRAVDGGMVLQQLFYDEEVRRPSDLKIDLVEVDDAELKLAKQLIGQISADSYDPTQFVDEEKKRILAAVDEKIAGKNLVVAEPAPAKRGEVVDLLKALQASLQTKSSNGVRSAAKPTPAERKPSKRASVKRAATATTKQRSSRN